MLPILVTLTSRSDSDVESVTKPSHFRKLESSKVSLKSRKLESQPKKINLMVLIRTLTISTTTFERMKENSMVFGRLNSVNTCFVYVGYYPHNSTEEFTEDYVNTPKTYLEQVTFDWEEYARVPENLKDKIRSCIIRIAIILGNGGGVIQSSIWPFWLGLGGKCGSIVYTQFGHLHSFATHQWLT